MRIFKISKLPNTKVIAFDRDKFTYEAGKKLKKEYPKRFFFIKKNLVKYNHKKNDS